MWENGSEKKGSRRAKLDVCAIAGNIQAQVLSAAQSKGTEPLLWATSGYWAWLLPAGWPILNAQFTFRTQTFDQTPNWTTLW